MASRFGFVSGYPFRHLVAAVAALALGLTASGAVSAQQPGPSRPVVVWPDLDGVVTDAAGTPWPGVRVELVEGAGGPGPVVRVGVTDSVGRYSFPSMPPGTYQLRTVSGLDTLSRSLVRVVAGRPAVTIEEQRDDRRGALLAFFGTRNPARYQHLGTGNRAGRSALPAIVCALTCWFPTAASTAATPLY